jgi:hypothetical protein
VLTSLTVSAGTPTSRLSLCILKRYRLLSEALHLQRMGGS